MVASGMGIIDPEKLGTLQPVAEGVAMVHAFANVGVIYGKGEVMIVDASSRMTAEIVLERIREATGEPIKHIIYTHGHVDHAGGAPVFIADAGGRGYAKPDICAHENVERRFRRYARTWAWNNEVNRRQFGMPKGTTVFPESFVPPSRTYRDVATFELSGERVELYHAEGETDDATWVHLPERHGVIVGDLLIGSMPNTGNPNKPQRYTLGWAEALDAIAAKRPQWIIPGHGSPYSGSLAEEVLRETARALRYLHDAVIDRLNAGKWPEEIVDEDIQLPPDLAAKKYLQPVYGAPAFVVRDVLRFYAGWWGGDPAELLPAKRADVAREIVRAAGADALANRIRTLLASGEARLALHLAVLLRRAEPTHAAYAELEALSLEALAELEPSFIARNFYAALGFEVRGLATGKTS